MIFINMNEKLYFRINPLKISSLYCTMKILRVKHILENFKFEKNINLLFQYSVIINQLFCNKFSFDAPG